MAGGSWGVVKPALRRSFLVHEIMRNPKTLKWNACTATFSYDSTSNLADVVSGPRITKATNVVLSDCCGSSLFTKLALPMVHSIRAYGTKFPKKEQKSKKGAKPKVMLSDEEMMEILDIESLREDFSRLLEKLKEEFVKHLSLRTSVGSIDTLKVHYEGDEYPLNEIAQVIRKNPTLIVINATSFPQALKAILEAIQNCGMNLNPQQDGTTIYVPIPQLTREHREVLSKNAKAMFNRTKDEMREVQNKAIKNIRKKKEGHSEDLIFNVTQQIMALEESYVSQAEALTKNKLNELLALK